MELDEAYAYCPTDLLPRKSTIPERLTSLCSGGYCPMSDQSIEENSLRKLVHDLSQERTRVMIIDESEGGGMQVNIETKKGRVTDGR